MGREYEMVDDTIEVDNDGLAELYDKEFHEVIERDPHHCRPWIEHIRLLKTLKPVRTTKQIFRITEISKLEKIEIEDKEYHAQTQQYRDINDRIFATYERATQFIPLSYKIWYNYIKDKIEELSDEYFENSEGYLELNTIIDRSIVHLYAYPAIYIIYGSFLRFQNRITPVRRLYDKALLNMPITQHHLIWNEYLSFVHDVDLLPLGRSVFRRYIQLKPNYMEVLYQFLKSHRQYDEASRVLCELLNDDAFTSESGKTQYDLWIELCELIRDNSQEIKSIPIDSIIKEGINKYTDQVASLWLILADIYILRGQLHIARDIYEEGLRSVTTVQDFSNIFDVYAKFLENYAKQINKTGNNIDTLMVVDRLENLIDNRAMLLASVKLKQNIHNVYNWLNYIQLYKEQPKKMAEIYAEAVQTVDPKRCVGRIVDLWIGFAGFYEDLEDLYNADKVYEKAVNANFKYVDDLATIWCCWIELYLRHKNFPHALELSRRSVDAKGDDSVSKRLHRSVKLWSLCLDMELNFGTIETCRATFNRMVELKVVTPQIALTFAMHLEDRNYFEGSFTVFEKCVALFKWPQLYYLYLPYLTKFVKRYRGTKLERAREIFEQCINFKGECTVPPKFVKYIFYLYAHMEEEFGLIKNSLGILENAIRHADPDDQLKMIKLYIAKTTDFHGIVHTRKIYQSVLEFVNDDIARELCHMYIQMERGLGEIDRARAIFIYCSQLCDPTAKPQFWKVRLQDNLKCNPDIRIFIYETLFELGDEWNFKDGMLRSAPHYIPLGLAEMLRIQRSVQAQYSKTHYNTEEITNDDNSE